MNHRLLVGIAVGATAFAGILGGTSLNAIQANAQDTQVITAQNQPTQGQPTPQNDKSQGGHVGANGKREELLTGDTAEKVKAAALAAVPGGTIDRVETEADGNGVYEAHMTKADGSRATVFFDANFKVTSTQDGMH